MGLRCESLIQAWEKYNRKNPRQTAQFARDTGVTHNTLSRLPTGKQKTIEFSAWEKIHRYDPSLFPAPFVEKKPSDVSENDDLASKYPVFGKILDHVREAKLENYSEKAILQILSRLIDYEAGKETVRGEFDFAERGLTDFKALRKCDNCFCSF